jgi:hypothetical protein
MSQPNFPNPNYGNQGAPNQGQPNQGYPNQGYPTQAHPAQAHPAQAYPTQAYPPQAYPPQAYPAQASPAQAYPAQPYPAQPYPAQAYPAQAYPAQAYPAQAYPAQAFPAPGIANQAFPNTNPTGAPTLGTFGHSLRKKNFKKSLKNARLLLVFMGAAIIFLNVGFVWIKWGDLEGSFENAIRHQERQLPAGMVIDPAKVEAARREFYKIIYIGLGLIVAVGSILIVLGMTIHLAPLPIAISALAIFVGYNAILAVMDVGSIAEGWIWKILVIGGLLKVINSAKAYQSDLRKAEDELAAQGRPMILQ